MFTAFEVLTSGATIATWWIMAGTERICNTNTVNKLSEKLAAIKGL